MVYFFRAVREESQEATSITVLIHLIMSRRNSEYTPAAIDSLRAVQPIELKALATIFDAKNLMPSQSGMAGTQIQRCFNKCRITAYPLLSSLFAPDNCYGNS